MSNKILSTVRNDSWLVNEVADIWCWYIYCKSSFFLDMCYDVTTTFLTHPIAPVLHEQ